MVVDTGRTRETSAASPTTVKIPDDAPTNTISGPGIVVTGNAVTVNFTTYTQFPGYHAYLSDYQPPVRLAQRKREFQRLVNVWREETADNSIVKRRMMHWAYQRIIGIGPEALPWILEELRREPDFWFWALESISHANHAEGCTTFDDAVNAWLRWGEHEGYIV